MSYTSKLAQKHNKKYQIKRATEQKKKTSASEVYNRYANSVYQSPGMEELRCESSFCRSTVGLQQDPDTGTIYCAACWERYEQSRTARASNSTDKIMCMTKNCKRTYGLERDPVNGNMYCQSCWNEFDEHLANGYTSADAHAYMTTGGSSESEGLSSSEEEEPLITLEPQLSGDGDDEVTPEPTPDAGAVYDRLYHGAAKRRQARKQAIAKKEKQVMSKLSFKPTIPQRVGSGAVRRRKGKPLHVRLHEDHSRRARRKKRMQEDKEAESLNKCTFTPSVPSVPGGRRNDKRSVFSRMSNDISRRHAALKKDGYKVKEKTRRELEHCTFQPRESSKHIRRARNKKSVVDRLTSRTRQDVIGEREEQRKQREVLGCTFKPDIASGQPGVARLTPFGERAADKSKPVNVKKQKETSDRLSKPVTKAEPDLPTACTFHPSISAKSALMAPIVISHYEDYDDEEPVKPRNVWENLHQTQTKHTDLLPSGAEFPYEPKLCPASRRKARRREERINDRLYGAKPSQKRRSKLQRLLSEDADEMQENMRSQPVVMRVGSPRYTNGSSKPKRNASAVVVKDITELMRTSAALDIRSKKSSQTKAIERLSSRRPYIAPTAPGSQETLGSSVMRGWEKRGVFGVIKAKKEW